MAGEFPCLRGTQGMVPVASGGDRCGTLYGSQTDEVAGADRGTARPGPYHDPCGPGPAAATGCRTPGLCRQPPECPVGSRSTLQALEQALAAREVGAWPLIHHSDRDVQYVSLRYSERLSQAGITPSVGRVGDSYDNALAETVIGLYKTELIRRQKSWQTLETVEYATLAWVDWFNHRRLLQKETLYD